MYYDWPAQLYLIDGHGGIRVSQQAAMDVREILPGRPYTVVLSMPLTGLEKGTYDVAFAILDPLTQRPAVRLAMDNPRGDLIQTLGTVRIPWMPPWQAE
jgi:hypothetical protein